MTGWVKFEIELVIDYNELAELEEQGELEYMIYEGLRERLPQGINLSEIAIGIEEYEGRAEPLSLSDLDDIMDVISDKIAEATENNQKRLRIEWE